MKTLASKTISMLFKKLFSGHLQGTILYLLSKRLSDKPNFHKFAWTMRCLQ
jgi:hypothetical protein